MPRRPSQNSSEGQPARFKQGGLVFSACALLALLTWIVFGQTLNHGFINYDDPDYVTRNAQVTRGLTADGIVWAFTHVHAANWHPLTWISHMVDCEIYGLNPRGHHLTNIILHGATAIVLFLALRQMTDALWRSGLVAALFAIHPLRVESVAWVAERKDVLSGLFFVLTLFAYIRYVRGKTRGRYLVVLLLAALGLMAKPMLVTLPFVLLLLDYWPLRRFTTGSPEGNSSRHVWRILVEKLPLVVLSIASSLITIVGQRGAMQSVNGIPLTMRIGNALISCTDYLRALLWAPGLAAHYPFSADRITMGNAFLSLALLGLISTAVILAKKWGYPITGWLWFLIMLGPVIGIVQVGIQARADRYTYLPQIGLYILVAWALGAVVARWRATRVTVAAIVILWLGALTFSARALTSTWQNSETVWRHALAVTDHNAVAEQNLGEALYEQGRLDEAIGHYEIALRDDPRLATAHVALGVALLETGHATESLAQLEQALAIDPNHADAHYNIGNTLLQMRLAAQAVSHYTRAVELNPIDVEAANNLAWVLSTSSDPMLRDGSKALSLAQRADSLTDRKSNVIHATLAAAYAESGRFSDAVVAADRAIAIANSEGNVGRAEAIRRQREAYINNQPYRE